MDWRPYAISLAIGLAVGGLYALLGTRSPAPPIIALLGLLGMLAGEAAVQWLRGHTNVVSDCLHSKSFVIAKTSQNKNTPDLTNYDTPTKET